MFCLGPKRQAAKLSRLNYYSIWMCQLPANVNKRIVLYPPVSEPKLGIVRSRSLLCSKLHSLSLYHGQNFSRNGFQQHILDPLTPTATNSDNEKLETDTATKLSRRQHLRVPEKMSSDITTIVNRVLDEFKKTNKFRKSEQPPTVAKLTEIVGVMQVCKISVEAMLVAAKALPKEVDSLGVEVWQRALATLESFGFHGDQLAAMLIAYREIFNENSKALSESITALRGVGFSDGELQAMLAAQPEILEVEPKKLVFRHKQLQKVFCKTDVKKLVRDAPSLLTDVWEKIEAKIHHVCFEMGLAQETMVKTAVFERSLLHLETRHAILQRAGLFEKPNKEGRTKIENPSLKEIVDSSDGDFVRKVAGISREELQTFKELFKAEKEELEEVKDSDEEDESSDDDSSSDEESSGEDEKMDSGVALREKRLKFKKTRK